MQHLAPSAPHPPLSSAAFTPPLLRCRYDFAVFGIFAQEIGLCFFTDDSASCAGGGGDGSGGEGGGGGSASTYSYILFAGGFLVRPLGGMLFGWLADRRGRAASLMLSIIGMAVPTLAIAALPCRSQIGLAAPVILTICRLLQGVAAGGELPSALVYAVERAPPQLKATFGALVQVRVCSFVSARPSPCMHACMYGRLESAAAARGHFRRVRVGVYAWYVWYF